MIFLYIVIAIGLTIAALATFSPKFRWAVFGNDEDGPYGPPFEGRETFYPKTTWGAIKWWCRNPCHNLCVHVINWPGGPYYHLKGTGLYIGWRPPDGRFGFKPQFWNKD